MEVSPCAVRPDGGHVSQGAPADAGTERRTARWWWVIAPAAVLVLVALCLRAPFAAVGPLLGELGDELGLSTGALAVVTALPLVCFGLISPFAPVLGAWVLTLLPEALRGFSDLRLVLNGLIIVGAVLFLPRGLLPFRMRRRAA